MLIDLTGQRFGRLTVLERAGSYQYPFGGSVAVWRCRCDCGEVVDIIGKNLKAGATRSCGCLRRDMIRERAARKRLIKQYGFIKKDAPSIELPKWPDGWEELINDKA